MIDTSIARRYAKALFDIATDKDQTTKYQAELQLLVDNLNDNAEFETLLYGQVISAEQKKDLVKKVFGAEFSADTMNFVCLVLDKGRANMLPEMLKAYEELMDDAAGIIPVKVTAAFELSAEQLNDLSAAFEKKLSAPVRLITSVDKTLIGGIKAQVGDTVYDGSLSGRLSELSRRLCK